MNPFRFPVHSPRRADAAMTLWLALANGFALGLLAFAWVQALGGKL